MPHRRAATHHDETETDLASCRGERPEHLRRGRLADLRTEVVGLLHDEHHRRDPSDLSQLEHRGRETIYHEFLNVRRYPLQVDDRRLALDHELVDARALLREDLDLA